MSKMNTIFYAITCVIGMAWAWVVVDKVIWPLLCQLHGW